MYIWLHFYDSKMSYIVEKCQANSYSFFNNKVEYVACVETTHQVLCMQNFIIWRDFMFIMIIPQQFISLIVLVVPHNQITLTLNTCL